jgi:hypothetical protein
MFPNTRISLTITTFGQSLINQLPHDYNQEELEAVMAIVNTGLKPLLFAAYPHNQIFS